MAMTEPARHELYEDLRQSIGDSSAGTLMSALPPVGWADVATKQDLVLLKQDLVLLKQDLVQLKHEFKSDLAQLELRMDLRFDSLANALRAEWRGEMNRMMLTMTAANTALAGLILAAVKFV